MFTYGDEVVVIEDCGYDVLGVEDGASDRLPDVVDHLLPVGHEGRGLQLQVATESLLSQPTNLALAWKDNETDTQPGM